MLLWKYYTTTINNDYADKYQIYLIINDKCIIGKSYPLLKSTEHNNVEIVKILIEYANKKIKH